MSACANPLHSASTANRTKRDFRARVLWFPSKNLDNGVPRCRCCRHVLPGHNCAIVVVQAKSLPVLEQQVCRLLAYGGRRYCELARPSVRDLWLTAPTRFWNV